MKHPKTSNPFPERSTRTDCTATNSHTQRETHLQGGKKFIYKKGTLKNSRVLALLMYHRTMDTPAGLTLEPGQVISLSSSLPLFNLSLSFPLPFHPSLYPKPSAMPYTRRSGTKPPISMPSVQFTNKTLQTFADPLTFVIPFNHEHLGIGWNLGNPSPSGQESTGGSMELQGWDQKRKAFFRQAFHLGAMAMRKQRNLRVLSATSCFRHQEN